MATETSPQPGPSFGRRLLLALGKLAKFTLRLLFVVIIGVLLGGGIYWAASYGVAMVNRQVFQPIREHTLWLADLESRHTRDYGRLNEQIQTLQEQTQTLQEQIAAQERQGDATREALDALQVRLATSETQLDEIQTALDTAQENLSALETRQDAFEPDVAELETTLAKLETAIDTLETALDTLTETVAQTAGDVETLSVILKDESPLADVRTEVQLLKAMELLTRARLLLAQDNPGMATTEVQEARDVLLALSATIPVYQQDALTAIVQRLDLGLANLPNAPRLANDDFEIAWQLLRRGLPTPPEATPLLSPLTEPAMTATETVTPTITPTPRP